MASPLDYLTQGTRILLASYKSRFFPKKYAGSAEDICHQIIDECWNGRFFQTSTTNFSQFWTRDFGWCTQSLLTIGHISKVHKTLRYALNRFKQANNITTTLTPSGKPFDFPTMAVDSLPWFIHSIKISKFPYYDHRQFLNQQIKIFFEKTISPDTGLVKPAHFSSIKDFALRNSSCYDNCMVALLAKDLKEMKLFNPFEKFDYSKLIITYFWNGNYFFDDLNKNNYVAGDANLFPFICGIIKDYALLKSAIQQIEEAGLDHPFPLKYTSGREQIKFIAQEIFLRNYESNSIWTHLGPLFIKLLKEVNPSKAKEHQQKYTQLIEKHQNYLEVFFPDGRPFRSPFYYCDQGMLWAVNYLTL